MLSDSQLHTIRFWPENDAETIVLTEMWNRIQDICDCDICVKDGKVTELYIATEE